MKVILRLRLFAVSLFLAIFFVPHSVDAQSSKYKKHIKTAAGHGLPPIQNSVQVKSYVKRKKLTTVSRSKGYTVNKLTHSKPYLVPKANRVLKEIAGQFYAKSKSTFTVTSLTRTLHDQNRLTRVNRNAMQKLSSHNFGCSFDISYIRFNKRKGRNPRLEKILQNILVRYQNKGKIYFIKEHRESCFHVTVRS